MSPTVMSTQPEQQQKQQQQPQQDSSTIPEKPSPVDPLIKLDPYLAPWKGYLEER